MRVGIKTLRGRRFPELEASTASVSILEAIERCQDLTGKTLTVEYVEASRLGDHITYISDLHRLRGDYPHWEITRSLDDIFWELTDR